ncbi:homoserine O-acetyltransferase [Cyphellophora europaea CBS 101466]|uniref:Homoserine O-acetyltransferase n=1 Tax=Cyphellophora europaea (strain CBS 101466) TaxID=1220924 RepID=W2RK84_CYPE1|nr:homoserine O-acetyltransferase [Cyphellophora europaea CBS 101466]ETN36877.1 homoserine O-acetyltransferase [Cyphellophora europaea CBS 101466]
MKRHLFVLGLHLLSPLAKAQGPAEQAWPTPTAGNFTIPNFAFDSGETLDVLELHYKTLGKLQVNDDGSNNAVFIMHGSTGSSEQFLNDDFAGALFNPGQILDADKYFIILRDSIGHGNSSTPRNTGLHARFPKYQYSDMVRVDHQLLTEHLGVYHLRLVMGVSMGGMHTWMWGEQHPDFMDALMPIASLPVQITGQNRLWRRFFMDLIQSDPEWKGGDYETQPLMALQGAMSVLQVMFAGPQHLAREFPTRDAMDEEVDQLSELLLDNRDYYDVNNQLYAYNASYTYDPEADLGKIMAPLTAVNTADDLMNPPDPDILRPAVQNQMAEGLGKAVIIPASNKTIGHGSYILADLWKDELVQLLARSERS